VVRSVLSATAKELSRAGYAALRVEDVAARSGVNKTTVYRRWPTKAELVAALIKEVMGRAEPIDTGSVRGDLRASLCAEIAGATRPLGRGILRIVQSERTVPEIDAIARRLRDEMHDARVAMVERGIARGELPEGIDPHLVVDLVSAPVLRRALTFGDAVDARYLDGVLDVVFAGIAVRSE
jgi:AcrR family transcriptional regulator